MAAGATGHRADPRNEGVRGSSPRVGSASLPSVLAWLLGICAAEDISGQSSVVSCQCLAMPAGVLLGVVGAVGCRPRPNMSRSAAPFFCPASDRLVRGCSDAAMDDG